MVDFWLLKMERWFYQTGEVELDSPFPAKSADLKARLRQLMGQLIPLCGYDLVKGCLLVLLPALDFPHRYVEEQGGLDRAGPPNVNQTFLCHCVLFPLRSNNSDSAVRSTESACVRQPAKSKIRRHNNRLSSVFNQSPNLRDGGQRGRALSGDRQAADDPAELSSQMSVPGVLKIFGSDICQGTNYKSVLATTQSSAKELVREALER